MALPKTPRTVDIEITSACNLRCGYCSHFSSDGDVARDLPADRWLAFFEELRDCAVLEVSVQGGEPFMRGDLPEIIDGITRNRMRFNILTNGTLITDELAAYIASTGRCNFVQVSIDGSAPDSHDAFRGAGSFSRALAGLRTLLKHGVPATARVTIHRRNVRDLDEVCRLLLDDVGLPEISTNSAAPLGLCRKNTEQVELTPEERVIAMSSLLRLSAAYKGRIRASAGPLAEARTWIRMERALRGEEERPPRGGSLTGCGGAMNKLAVRADGVIVPCGLIPGMELGRINHDHVRDIWLNHPELNRFRDRTTIPLTDFDYCRDCRFIDYCTGSCPAIAYSVLNELRHPAPDSCYRRFLEQGGALPDEDLSLHA